jgi:hypothetical protein
MPATFEKNLCARARHQVLVTMNVDNVIERRIYAIFDRSPLFVMTSDIIPVRDPCDRAGASFGESHHEKADDTRNERARDFMYAERDRAAIDLKTEFSCVLRLYRVQFDVFEGESTKKRWNEDQPIQSFRLRKAMTSRTTIRG